MPAPCVTWFEFDLHHRVAPSHDRAIADDPLSNSEGVGVSLSPAECCLHGRQGMEHLWSRAVATGGNRWQMGLPRKRLEQAKTVAMGCDQLPGPQNGKEGGRRFESVRGLSVSSCSGPVSVVLIGDDWQLRRPSDVLGLDVGGFDVRVAVEEPDRVLASVACEVAVMAVDHGQAGSHVAREVEG
jgi:hypothetical protein